MEGKLTSRHVSPIRGLLESTSGLGAEGSVGDGQTDGRQWDRSALLKRLELRQVTEARCAAPHDRVSGPMHLFADWIADRVTGWQGLGRLCVA